MNALVARRLCCLAWAIFFSLQAALAAPPTNRPGARTSSPADSPAVASPAQNRASWNFPSSKFITALCVDQQNNLWVGTEDEGIWRCPADGAKPQQFMPKDGLGDEHCYALACDTLGRVWAGHQSHGVSVWNGQKWQNYEVVGGLSRPDTLNGPLGERIFDIAVCPTDGDVWMATSLGLARYRLQQGEWQYFTRLEGLPSDQIQAIAFDRKGRMYAGTQCDGLAMADGPDYRKWRTVTENPRAFFQGTGQGLPSDLINDVLVGSDGTVWAATSFGLALSRDRGNTWRYVRGKDFAAKVEGLIEGVPKGWQKPAHEELDQLLAEDYVTCLAEGQNSSIWIGHRKAGFESRTADTGEVIKKNAAFELRDSERHPMDGYISALLPISAEQMVVGRYVQGLTTTGLEGDQESRQATAPPLLASPVRTEGRLFPMAAKSLSKGELDRLVTRAKKAGQIRQGAIAAALLDEDWMTKGDWVGRYGKQYNIMCATMSPMDQQLVWDYKEHRIEPQIHPKYVAKGNWLRSWVHWVQTDNPNTLYNPIAGVRRQSEWDDNGEEYPMTLEGPDIWINIKVPVGVHRLSLYFFNKDGHDGNNRCRDYLVEVRSGDLRNVDVSTVLARSRVRDFWGGTYKRFVVGGPATFMVKVSRNYSYNAIISGVFVDKLVGPPKAYDLLPTPYLGGIYYQPPPYQSAVATTRPVGADQDLQQDPSDRAEQARNWPVNDREVRVQMLRIVDQSQSPQLASDSLRWTLGLWTPADRRTFAKTMDLAWDAQIKMTPAMIWQKERRPLSNR